MEPTYGERNIGKIFIQQTSLVVLKWESVRVLVPYFLMTVFFVSLNCEGCIVIPLCATKIVLFVSVIDPHAVQFSVFCSFL